MTLTFNVHYDGQESPMLHTKFHGNQPAGSREEKFLRVFTIYGHSGHLGHVTSIISTNFTIWLKMAKWFLRKAGLNFQT